MESITKQLVNIGHGMSKEIAADEPAVAKLLVELSSSLDVQYERGNALEAKCAALAAENAGLKSAIDATIGWQQSTDPENVESVRMLVDVKTPVTDAFLAEVRAQGVDDFCNMLGSYAKVEPERFNPQFADLYAKIVNRIFSEVMDNPEVYDLGTMSDWLERESENSRAYADLSINHHAQLRKGVQS
ncbi:hypothetical protein K1J23_16700 [Enterobacter hormaechei]|uniref:hypothetical protein n=1 Tax=Enterobacter hormaechei TaxID=158836 RepID=UPI001C6430B2|nr:hypothetical protein [Enterobacter hormaechei]MBW7684639.1 hypothetical protein [Enterobacter hormaechei]